MQGRSTSRWLLFFVTWWCMAACQPTLPPVEGCKEDSACGQAKRCVEGACVCVEGLASCGAGCVDLFTDTAHCGGCGVACAKGQRCTQGMCQCPAKEEVCAGGCVDLLVDTKHCGACNQACEAGQRCAQGRCVLNCPSETPDRCEEACVRFSDDPRHCGQCGKACVAGQICQRGACACPPGQRLCSGACVDALRDPIHCGACGNNCPSGQRCASGECVTDCPISTPTTCFGGCVDTRREQAHCGDCGQSCPEDQRCEGGRCACPRGLVLCAGRCVDTLSDISHCGACDAPCAAGRLCGGGACVANCPEATPTACFGGCFATLTDARHCGAGADACGNACPQGQLCQGGACRCPTGMLFCEGRCLDPKVSRLHCGACDRACAAGEVCADGQCVTSCPTITPTVCDGGCFHTQEDARHCGSCGRSCSPERRCREGVCACPAERLECQGRCIDPQSDAAHCGACDNTCSSDQLCEQGRCLPRCAPQEERCGGSCVNTKTDSQHCGACDNTCEETRLCVDGRCECGVGRKDCGDGRCLDILYNPQHCGACGQTCSQGQVCDKGACRCPAAGCPIVHVGSTTDPQTFGAFYSAIEAANGDYYLPLVVAGSVDFDGRRYNSPPNSVGIFLLIYSKDGIFRQSYAAQSTANEGIEISAMAFDDQGTLHIAGSFKGQIRFGTQSLQGTEDVKHGFLVQLAPNGQWQSPFLLETNELQQGNGTQIQIAHLGFTANGGRVLAGRLFGRLSLSGQTIEAYSPQAFAISLPPQGAQPRLTVTPSPPPPSPAEGQIQEVFAQHDPQGGLYLTGRYEGTIRFGNTQLAAPPRQFAHFVARLDPQGAWNWAYNAPQNNNEPLYITHINAGIVVAGSHIDAFQIGGKSLTASPSQKEQAYLALLQPNGDAAWLHHTQCNNLCQSIFLAKHNNTEAFWVNGVLEDYTFKGLTFQTAQPPPAKPDGPNGILILRIDEMGNLRAASELPFLANINGEIDFSLQGIRPAQDYATFAGAYRGNLQLLGNNYSTNAQRLPLLFRLFTLPLTLTP